MIFVPLPFQTWTTSSLVSLSHEKNCKILWTLVLYDNQIHINIQIFKVCGCCYCLTTGCAMWIFYLLATICGFWALLGWILLIKFMSNLIYLSSDMCWIDAIMWTFYLLKIWLAEVFIFFHFCPFPSKSHVSVLAKKNDLDHGPT